MTTTTEIQTLDWKNDFDLILTHIQKNGTPIKVSSFFTDGDEFPTSNELFLKKYSDMPLEIVKHSYAHFFSNVHQEKYYPLEKCEVKLGEFAARVSLEDDYRETWRCYENYIPKKFVDFAEKKLTPKDLLGKTDLRHEPSFYYRFFVGFKHQTTHPHLDWNCNNNILFQIYGNKKVYLFSPEVFNRLDFILHFAENDLSEIIRIMNKDNLNYYEIDLNEGEGLYIPPYYLHSVLYPTDSCSLALRFLPRKNNLKIHRLLPANNKLAFLLHYWHKNEVDHTEKIERICSSRSYQEATELYERYLKEEFHLNDIPKTSLDSLKYESFIFKKQQSFDYQMYVKKVKSQILSRGASHFSF